MRIYFPASGPSAGISIRAGITALLNGHKADRSQPSARKKHAPQITPGWNYRPKETIRRYTAVERIDAAASDALGSTLFVVNDVSRDGAFYEWAGNTFAGASPEIVGVHDESVPASH
jgi:hypothetical protein